MGRAMEAWTNVGKPVAERGARVFDYVWDKGRVPFTVFIVVATLGAGLNRCAANGSEMDNGIENGDKRLMEIAEVPGHFLGGLVTGVKEGFDNMDLHLPRLGYDNGSGSNTGGNNGSTGGSSDGSTGSTGGSTEIGDWKPYTIASGRAIGDETNFTACQVWDRKDPKSTVQVLIQPQVELYADPSTAEGTCWTVVDALSEQAIRNQLEYLAEKKKAEFASNGIDFKPGTVTIDSQDDTDVSSLPGDWNS